MIKIQIKRNELKDLFEFANKSFNNHNAQYREKRKVKKDIIIGKLGELAYKKLFEDKVSEINYTNNVKGDGGYDFIHAGFKIDVKTNRATYHDNVYFKKLTFDYIALMQIENISHNEINIIFAGYCDKDTVKKYSNSKNNFFEIKKRYFTNLIIENE